MSTVAPGSLVDKVEHAVEPADKPTTSFRPKTDPSTKCKCVEWHGNKSIKVVDRPKPLVTDPEDVLVRVTSTAICGSDLHMYTGWFPGMKSGDVTGHEFMGIIEDVGPEVTAVRKGDRVVISCVIGCGKCKFCKADLWSSCLASNSSKIQEAMYGASTGGFFGYSHLTGGYAGGQAEYVRVPFGNSMCLKVPETLKDEQVLFLADALVTAWHGCELGEVHTGDVVAIWGAGPVGMLAAHLCFHRGAKRVILIDDVSYRLEFAKAKIPGVEVIDFSKTKTLTTLAEMVGPDGLDVAIECAGFHYCHSLLHKIEMHLKLETDTAEILNEMLVAVRKGGRVSILGMYIGFTNHFNIGAFLEKQLTMRGGPVVTQKYWKMLLEKIERGEIDTSFIVTHSLSLDEAAHGYKIFNDKTDDCVKVVLKTGAAVAAVSA